MDTEVRPYDYCVITSETERSTMAMISSASFGGDQRRGDADPVGGGAGEQTVFAAGGVDGRPIGLLKRDRASCRRRAPPRRRAGGAELAETASAR